MSSIFKYMSRPHAVHCKGARDHAHGFDWARPGVARESRDWLADWPDQSDGGATAKLGQRLGTVYTVTFSLLGQRQRQVKKTSATREREARASVVSSTPHAQTAPAHVTPGRVAHFHRPPSTRACYRRAGPRVRQGCRDDPGQWATRVGGSTTQIRLKSPGARF